MKLNFCQSPVRIAAEYVNMLSLIIKFLRHISIHLGENFFQQKGQLTTFQEHTNFLETFEFQFALYSRSYTDSQNHHQFCKNKFWSTLSMLKANFSSPITGSFLGAQLLQSPHFLEDHFTVDLEIKGRGPLKYIYQVDIQIHLYV